MTGFRMALVLVDPDSPCRPWEESIGGGGKASKCTFWLSMDDSAGPQSLHPIADRLQICFKCEVVTMEREKKYVSNG